MLKSGAVFFIAVLMLPVGLLPAEEEYLLPRDYRVEFDNGLGYWYNIARNYESKGTAGVLIILGGPKKDLKRLLQQFHGIEKNQKNYLEEYNWIGIAPDTKDDAWRPDDIIPMKSFMDIVGKYNVDLQRVHILGLGIGGTLAANIGYGRADISTIVTIGSSIASVSPELLRKYPQKRVYSIISEKSKPQRKAAEKAMKIITSSAGRYARLRFVEGAAEIPPLTCELPAIFSWYKAMESGFDYAAAIDNARANIHDSIEEAIAKVREIESQPFEAGFWIELESVRKLINEKGEAKLSQCQLLVKTDPIAAKNTLTQLLSLFKGFPVANKARAELDRLDAAIKGDD